VSRIFRDPLFNYIAENTYLHYDEHIPAVRLWLREVAKYRTAEGRTLRDV
jgi:nucleoid-associated protein YejK